MRLLPRLLLVAGLVALTVACGDSSGPSGEDSAVQSETIAVHGDWRVAIHNEDGSLDREYVFANALLPSGTDAIAILLGLADDPGPGDLWGAAWWTVAFGDLAAPPDESVSPCTIDFSLTEPQVVGRNPQLTQGCALTSFPIAETSGELTISPVEGGARLVGLATATQDGSIEYVETRLSMVSSDVGAGVEYAFTGTDVGPFEDITAGQTIQVEVELTFESPAP